MHRCNDYGKPIVHDSMHVTCTCMYSDVTPTITEGNTKLIVMVWDHTVPLSGSGPTNAIEWTKPRLPAFTPNPNQSTNQLINLYSWPA